MRIYTIQRIELYEDLLHNGIAYCNRESKMCCDYRFQFDWMAGQMRKRVGMPLFEGIKYPLWVWQQYSSRKKTKPPMSPHDIPFRQEEAVMLELDVPEDQVLLSDFALWGLHYLIGVFTVNVKINSYVKSVMSMRKFTGNVTK